MKSTIVAIATPVGRSGIGVIRLSGADSLSIVRKRLFDKESFETISNEFHISKNEVSTIYNKTINQINK